MERLPRDPRSYAELLVYEHSRIVTERFSDYYKEPPLKDRLTYTMAAITEVQHAFGFLPEVTLLFDDPRYPDNYGIEVINPLTDEPIADVLGTFGGGRHPFDDMTRITDPIYEVRERIAIHEFETGKRMTWEMRTYKGRPSILAYYIE